MGFFKYLLFMFQQFSLLQTPAQLALFFWRIRYNRKKKIEKSFQYCTMSRQVQYKKPEIKTRDKIMNGDTLN